jgi:baseplate J-like protein
MADPGLGICGCCVGTGIETPARIDNPPGQSAVAYRVGTHATLKQSLLARLSAAELPALAGLTTREDSDFTIALCDGLATTLDVLAFYQERIANENFLRTATEKRSILELARLIGYQLAPGVAASTFLAFTLQEVPGSPALAAAPVDIPVGTRVQSVPGPGEQAQSFETVEVVEARTEWNAIPVQTTLAWHPVFGDRELWLVGVGSGLQPGDAILIVGQERLDDHGSERWDIRVLREVEEDRVQQRTRLSWEGPLGHAVPHVEPAASGATVYVFRQRAALFGHNAPDPRLMNQTGSDIGALVEGTGVGRTWKSSMFSIQDSVIDLDAAYPKVTPGSWLALVSNAASSHPSGLSGYVELYRANAVSFPSRTDFGLSSKVTRIEPDTSENLDIFRHRIRENLVLAQSEPVQVAERPLGYPLYGATLALGRLAPDIGPGRTLAVSGKRARIRLRKGRPDATLQLADGGSVTIKELDSLRMVAPPERQSGGGWVVVSPPQLGALMAAPGSAVLRLKLIDRDEQEGSLIVAAAAIELQPANKQDDEVQEIALVSPLTTAVTQDRDRTTFSLAAPLKYCYDRETARVNANVSRATHGETVNEILGSGDARVPNASFGLRQAPLTYVSASTASGRQSTLELRVNDLLWQEVSSLYARAPTERVYETAIDDQSNTTVRFGDGVEGARPPSGDHNIRARYRKGLGLAGNVASGKLTNLLTRPLGVTGATNPEPAYGGEDAEHEDKARANAPLTVLTLDRAVSIRDYQDFSRAFAAIAKAHALWIPSGPAHGVFLTVAGEQGATVPATSDTYRNLQAALRRYGDPVTPLTIVSFRNARFRCRLTVKVATDAEPRLVLPAVEARLREAFGFAARDFGQAVSVDEVAAVAQAVASVEAVQVVELHRSDAPTPLFVPLLFAALPLASPTVPPLPAELLTIDPGPLALEHMS